MTPEPEMVGEELLELMLGIKVDMKWVALRWNRFSGLKCERL